MVSACAVPVCGTIRDVVKRLHILVGLAGLAAFLLTGQYMDRWLGHLEGMPDGPRALYRSGHIYILFSASLNLLLGVYVMRFPGRTSRWLQYAGSALLVGGLGLFVYGFFAETPLALVERPMTREAIVADSNSCRKSGSAWEGRRARPIGS